jgi:broad specificity phosphatase PhoE
MRIFIVRHGETDWNLQKKIQGSSDIPLNQTGLSQANMIAKRLKDENFSAIFASPQSRASETGKIIASHHPNTPFFHEKAIREVSLGSCEGMTWEELVAKNPTSHFTSEEEYAYTGFYGDSECLRDRVEELKPVVIDWKNQYQGQNILLATHGFIKKGILVALGSHTFVQLQPERFRNTSLSVINLQKNPLIEIFNDNSHLDVEL